MVERLGARDPEPQGRRKPQPVRHLGEPFFDELVAPFAPRAVRQALQLLVRDQYAEADRISSLRGWGGAQPHGNDRYQYSLEQARRLTELLPGAELQRPSGSLLYSIGGALLYPMRYGRSEDDCPTTAQIDEASVIQAQLATGRFYETPSLFDPDPSRPRQVVWLLFTGNHVEGGPLSAYVAAPCGPLVDGRIDWRAIAPLLADGWDDPRGDDWPDHRPVSPKPPILHPPEPPLHMSIRS